MLKYVAYGFVGLVVLGAIVGKDDESKTTKDTNRTPDSVDHAYLICRLFDGTGLTSAPCEVSGWGATVNVTLDMTSSEARHLCQKVSGLAAQNGWSFDDPWTLQIKSPYSGDRSIAYCDL